MIWWLLDSVPLHKLHKNSIEFFFSHVWSKLENVVSVSVLGPQLAVPLTDLIKVSWRFCFTVFSQWSTITEENKILIDNQEYWWTLCASGNELIGFLPQWVTYTKLFPFNATYRDCDVPSIFLQTSVISGELRKNIFCDFERITGKSG